MKLPSFTLPGNDLQTYMESDFSKGLFVIFIYPKDSTPGCTQESIDFRDYLDDFKDLHVRVFGLSKDSVKSHNNFADKNNLPYTLLSDEDVDLIEKLDAWKEKSMYGKKYMGAERSTFVIKDGKITKEWRKVKVKDHAKEVLNFIKGTI
jgi:thioredoxin-dependent peroxiredoxin